MAQFRSERKVEWPRPGIGSAAPKRAELSDARTGVRTVRSFRAPGSFEPARLDRVRYVRALTTDRGCPGPKPGQAKRKFFKKLFGRAPRAPGPPPGPPPDTPVPPGFFGEVRIYIVRRLVNNPGCARASAHGLRACIRAGHARVGGVWDVRRYSPDGASRVCACVRMGVRVCVRGAELGAATQPHLAASPGRR